MWKLLLAMALPLVPLAAAHGDGLVRTQGAAEVHCEIRTKPMSGGVELEGVVASREPVSGTFEFEVRKTGDAGTSSSAQSGDFATDAGEKVIGEVGLGLDPGAAWDATLVLRWQGGETSCEATGPDQA